MTFVPLLLLSCGGDSAPAGPSASPVQPSQTSITLFSASEAVAIGGLDVPGVCCGLSVGWGWADNLLAGGRSSRAEMSAIRFDLPSQTSGRPIAKATLRLTVYHVHADLRVTPVIRAQAFSSAWTAESITGKSWAGLGMQSVGEVSKTAPVTADVPFELEVTTIVRNWASGTWKNYGLGLTADWYPDRGGPSDGFTGFRGTGNALTPDQRPQLIIEYQ